MAASIYVMDRVTKIIVEHELAGHEPLKLIPGVLQFTYTTNPGGAFGLFGHAAWLFLGATLLVCVAIVLASFNVSHVLVAAGLGLVLGGALGNLTDRLVRGDGLNGRVVDFIDFRIWPVFNLADAGIVVGAGLILMAGLRRATSS